MKTIESRKMAEKEQSGSPPSSDSGFVDTDSEVKSITPPKKTATNARRKERSKTRECVR